MSNSNENGRPRNGSGRTREDDDNGYDSIQRKRMRTLDPSQDTSRNTQDLPPPRSRPDSQSRGRDVQRERSSTNLFGRNGDHRSMERSSSRNGDHRSSRNGDHRSVERSSSRNGDHRSSRNGDHRSMERNSSRNGDHRSVERSSSRNGDHRSMERSSSRNGDHRSMERNSSRNCDHKSRERSSSRNGDHRSKERSNDKNGDHRSKEHSSSRSGDHKSRELGRLNVGSGFGRQRDQTTEKVDNESRRDGQRETHGGFSGTRDTENQQGNIRSQEREIQRSGQIITTNIVNHVSHIGDSDILEAEPSRSSLDSRLKALAAVRMPTDSDSNISPNNADRGRGRGNGRGRGRGRGRGGRGRGRGRGRGGQSNLTEAQHLERELENEMNHYDNVKTRPENLNTKEGESGQRVSMASNYFAVGKTRQWTLYNYSAKFTPELEWTRQKKDAVKQIARYIGVHIFDGSNMYCIDPLDQDPWTLETVLKKGNSELNVAIEFKLRGQVTAGDTMYLQIYNLIIRKCFELLRFTELGRLFYDSSKEISMDNVGLKLWPGFKTAIRVHDGGLMVCVEIMHKVLRTHTCYDVIAMAHMDKKQIKKELVGQVVITVYNHKTYKVDDVDFGKTPKSTFKRNGKDVSFLEYFNEQGISITNLDQPLLVSLPKKKDFHRGQTKPIILIPELCRMTGLSEDHRRNFNTMRELSTHTRQPPQERVQNIRGFVQRLSQSNEVQGLLREWGITISPGTVEFEGRVASSEKLHFGNTPVEVKDDWTDTHKVQANMFSSVKLTNWIVIVQDRDRANVDTLIRTMQNIAKSMQFIIENPKETIRIPNDKHPARGFTDAISQGLANHPSGLQMIFIILPDQRTDVYAQIKEKTTVSYGILTQCLQVRHLQPNRANSLRSVITKVVIQMNTKLGGEPWIGNNPFKKMQAMVVGFDVFHCGKRKESSIGAMVCTTNNAFSKHYSTISLHRNKECLSTNLSADLTKCILAYENRNKTYPDRIFMYRDGVGEGQLEYVHKTELAQLTTGLKTLYEEAGLDTPKLVFIIVTKKSNSRFFLKNANGSYENPKPGTIIDNTITLPERYDFYLIPQGNSSQGTVSPTTFNVIHDELGLPADKLQVLTNRFCHLYYNWSGTVAVPAVCQYAKKLSYFAGIALGQNPYPNEKLSHFPYFL